MPIELKHLRYIEAAERLGSFRKAAESISIRQSNLSRRIRDLEEMLGVRLFDRTSGGVRGTHPSSRAQSRPTGVEKISGNQALFEHPQN
ncbi:MAG: LysR family transcriptional regulator [Rhodospirillales bacterium]|nr:LysR family transcriptional regulator [Rhodospirillales bacterium]